MRCSGVWGGDLELFTAGLLFNTDIWVYSKETGNSWNVFSGKGRITARKKLKMSMIKAIIRPLIVLNHHLVDILIS